MIRSLLISALTITVLSTTPSTSFALSDGEPMPINLFVNLAKKLNPAVVSISTSSNPRSALSRRGSRRGMRDPFFDMLEQYLNQLPRYQQKPQQQALGTGFIIRKDGLIITNSHVISQADTINVHLKDDKTVYEAELIGKDQRTDIALIKIKKNKTKKQFPTAKLGTSKGLQVGEWVAAFGNPFGHTHSMSKGIVSAIGREIDELNKFPFIQTDASINPGNSGGPLVNTKGEVIGVNTAIDARAQGIGFAIPIDDVKSILPSLEKNGSLQRAYLGVGLRDIHLGAAAELGLKDTDGALIVEIDPKSPAAKAGLKEYDFVTQLNKKKIESSSDLIRAVRDTSAGKKVSLKYIRNGKTKTAQISLSKHPKDTKQKKKKSPTRKRSRDIVAPYGLGFTLARSNKGLAEEYELPPLKKPRPVVISVEPGSPARRAGLYPGDIILDINKKPIYKATNLKYKLHKNKLNILRVLRDNQVSLIFLEP